MPHVNRRSVLTGAGAAAAALAAGSTARAAAADPAPPAVPDATVDAGGFCADPFAQPAVVLPGDERYAELSTGVNQRWTATPDSVVLPTTTAQVLRIVQAAALNRTRVTVRSGGHCYADFVSNAETKTIIDLSHMNKVTYDATRNAFAVEPGVQLGALYEALYRSWGVAVPGGVCLTVGIGGHAVGGGFGLLTRQHGLVADHLDAVEMVVVDRFNRARVVTASRNPADPANDLWWASTGGGGGNFGIITKYWFRTPGAPGTAPGDQLPRPPKTVLISSVAVPWAALDQTAFTTLLRNFGQWYEQNSAPGAPATALSGVMFARHRTGGGVGLLTQVDGTDPNGPQLLADYAAALTRGTAINPVFPARRLPWLASTKLIGTFNPTLLFDPTLRSGIKTAFLRTAFTDDQAGAIYRQLMRTDFANPNATLQLAGAGGQMNAPASGATATAHRSSVLFAEFESFWINPADDAANTAWLRDIYGETFATTGGYPAPNAQNDGCYINNPDPDIVDPAVNRSGVPWSTLYYGDNYARLQQVKSRWDPTDFFHHSQSIRPA
ncbi:FAD-binding oxidoreductase [Yinghuangia seranimata]|uniref:FAD-binding oxidoreductase n=1 Tax=Yinghuangia seranimata TaxID=408067 RepID=UPI00248BD80A|nr:FAD-binding protein [Yinghuangia seranimata]MDI2127674.1 FAD-binding protein [Yinghuangia seranimata]